MAKRYIWDFNAPAGGNLKTWDEWESEQAERSLDLMNAAKSPGIKTYKPGELDLYDSSITPEHVDKNALLDALSTSQKPSLVKRIEDSKAWRTVIGNPEEGYGVGDMAEAVMMANPAVTGMAAGKGLQGAGTVLKKVGDPALDALKTALFKTPAPVKKLAGAGAAITGYETIKGATDPEYADRRETFPSQFGASLRGGVGDTVKLAGSAAEWQGKDKLADTLKQAGIDISEGFESKQVPFTWKSWFDPDWYANNVARTIPTTAALIPAMVIAYKGGAQGAAMRGFGKFGQAVIGSLAGAAASRPLESAMEAGGAYEDALARGLSTEEAEAAAQKVYEANLSLAGLDAAQLALAFAPQGKLAGLAGRIGKTGVAASKLAGVALTEAGEEGYQQAVQQSATGADQRGILAQMLNPNTEMKESMAIGGLFGVGMGGAGVINDVFANPADLPDRIQKDVAANLPPELKTQVAQNIENFMDQGMDEAAATEKALDELAETPEGQGVIAASTQAVANDILNQGTITPLSAEELPQYIEGLKGAREQAISDQVKYLKSESGKGVTKRMPKVDDEGYTIGWLAGHSNNPPWYQALYAQLGRSPNQGEWRTYAEKSLREGYDDIPPDAGFLRIENELSKGIRLPEEWHSLEELKRELMTYAEDDADIMSLLSQVEQEQLAIEEAYRPQSDPQAEQVAQPQQDMAEAPAPNIVYDRSTGEPLQVVGQPNPEFYVVQNQAGKRRLAQIGDVTIGVPAAQETGQAPAEETNVPPQAAQELTGEAVPQPQPQAAIKVQPEQTAAAQSETEAGVNDTTWYHGTGKQGLTPEAIDPLIGNHEALFGHGVYLTDSPNVAQGYAKARSKKSGAPSVYEVKVNVNSTLDLEGEVAPEFSEIMLSNSEFDPGVRQTVQESINEKGATNESVMQAYRHALEEYSADSQIPSSELVENFQDILIDLKRAGYDALTHTGGKRTGGAPHRVLIMLDPNDISGTGRKDQITAFSQLNNVPEEKPAAVTDEVVIENPEAYNETKDGIKFLRGDGDQTAGGENTDVDSDRGRDTDSLHSGETERIVLGGQNDEAAERRISDLTQALRRIPDEDFRTDELRAADAGEYEKADVKKAVELAGTYGAEVFLFRWEKPGPRYFSATLVENVIYIDADSNESSLNAVAHELIHYLKRNKPNIYKTIRDAAFQHVTVKKFVDYKQAYSVRGYAEEDILEELICDIGAQVLLKSKGMEGAFFTQEEWNNLFGTKENANKAEEAIGKVLAEGTVKNAAQKSPPEGLKPKLKRETQGAAAPIFYSQLQRIIEQKMPNRTVAGHVLAIIKGGQAKQEEIKWSGIEDWLNEQKGRVTKQDVLDFLKANEVQVEEVDPSSPKYHQYQLPGGENYREMLFTLPRKIGDNGYYVDGYSSSHWDEANVLTHVRFNDRTGPNGEKILHVEEVQSDWHQEGRKKGYASDAEAVKAKIAKEYNVPADTGDWSLNVLEKAGVPKDLQSQWYDSTMRGKVPDAPFKTTWHEFVLKRMLRYAAENGYDRIAWTTGEQQAERYDLRKQVSEVSYYKNLEGNYDVDVTLNNGGKETLGQGMTPADLEGQLGKDVAQRLVDKAEKDDAGTLSGVDLKFGGEGMKGFYDRMIPSFLNKYAKKWGAKVHAIEIEMDGKETAVHSLPITDAMRESVLYLGQPMFKREGMTLKELSDELGLALKPAREAMLKPSFHAANILAKIFTGKDIVLFRGKGIQGATIGNTIFLNEKVKSPVLYVVKHEIIHALGNTDPESYAQLLKIAKEHFDGNPTMFKHYEDYGYAADEAWDEFTSDVVSEIMESDGFWAQVREKAPGLIRTIIDIIDSIIAKYKKAVSKKESMLKHIQDMEEFKAKVAGVTAEALARRQQGTAKPGAGGEVAAKTSLKREKEAKFTLPDQEVQERIEKARGVPKDSLRANIVELLSDIYKKAHREFEHLPRTGEFAELRNSLLNLRKQKGISADKTLQVLDDVTKPLDEYEYDVFSHKVIFDDLAHEFKEGNLLPFGLTEENFEDIKNYIDDEAAKLPKVQQAIEKRKAAWKEIKDAYIEAQQAVGFNVENRLKKEDYYHHQVLEYANKKGIMGTGKKLRIATGRGFLKQRGGSSYDINSDYLQAEFEVMAQMMQDAAIAKTVKVVKDNHDIVSELKREAVRLNDEAMMEEFARILEIMGDTETTPEQLYKQTLNKKQAIAFGKLYKMAARGELPEGADGKYRKLIEAMAKVDNAEDFPENHRKQLWQYLNYLAGNENENEQSQIVARTIFKGRAQKMKTIKGALGKNYVTWEDLIPEGYTLWQPREGHMFYMTNSIPQGMAEQLFCGIMDELKINADMLKKEMAIGQKYPELVVKEEVALTLEELYSNLNKQSPVAKFLYFTPYRAWKQWQLISPRRYFRYNTRNMTGDLDAVLAGNPSALRPDNLKKAWGDLWQAFFSKDKTMSPELKGWFERGGFESLMQAQEINDINRNRQFGHLMKGRIKSTAWEKVLKSPATLWNAYWDFARTTTDFREALLRYACYLDYAGQIEQNKGKPNNFGASNQDEIMALKDEKDRAAKLANELMGAYDEVSVIGTWLADRVFPFWRWNEVNFFRYSKLFRNAYRNGKLMAAIAGKTTGVVIRSPYIAWQIGKFLVKAAAFTGMITAWNLLFFGDEEKELPEDVRNRLHIIFGRDKDGKVLYFSRLGALQDFLDWFGLDTPVKTVQDFLSGRKSAKEIAIDWAKADANKIVNALTPIVKTPAELAFNRKIYPDVFNAMPIRDRWQYLADSFGLGNEYKALTDKPSRGYGSSIPEMFIYKSDPYETAYWANKENVRKYLKKIGKYNEGYSESIRSDALYNIKLSMRYGDEEAFKKYLLEYVALGGTAKGLKQSIKSLDPLDGLSKDDKLAYINSLDAVGRENLAKSINYYQRVIGGDMFEED